MGFKGYFMGGISSWTPFGTRGEGPPTMVDGVEKKPANWTGVPTF